MKKLISYIYSLLFLPLLAFGQPDPLISIPYTSISEIKTIINEGTPQPIFYDGVLTYNSDDAGNILENTLVEVTTSNVFKVDSLTYVLSWSINSFSDPFTLEGKNFVATLDYKLIYFSQTTGIDSTEIMQISVDYDELENTKYQAKSYQRLKGMPYVRLKLLGITIFDRNTNTVANESEITNYEGLLELRQNLSFSNTLRPNPTDIPTNPSITKSTNDGYLNLTWNGVSWAKAYDVEYLYVDDFSEEFSVAESWHKINYDFRRNSTRVTVPANGGLLSYQIPRIFDYGYLIFRVRAVGEWGANPVQRIEGEWSLPDSGLGLPGIPGPLDNAVEPLNSHEKGKMNWQHIATFAEEGKRKDAITYRDGTLRERQTSMSISSDNNLITSEQIYDHVGRPSIQFLPTPHAPGATATEPPVIGYFEEFNVHNSGASFNLSHFELITNDCTNPNPTMGEMVANTSGAGKYYSAQNSDKTNHNAYIPDAQQFPYAQMEYTPDNSGKPRRQGAAGGDFRLGSGHEVSYFYAAPSQNELDRLFGTDVGFAKHYQKEIMIDANGQISISYKDAKNNVIATGLAGENPDNLTPLDNQISQNITLRLLDAATTFNPEDNSLSSAKTIYITGEPENLIPVDLNYEIAHTDFVPADCPSNTCYSCVYDLNVTFQKECGTMIFDTTLVLGNLANLLSCDPLTRLFDRSLLIESGPYVISKKLTVSEAAINQAVAHYLENCVDDLDIPLESPGICDPEPCIACPTVEESYMNYGTVAYNYQLGGSVNLPTLFPVITDTDCDPFCLDNLPNLLETTLQTLLSDVSPGGQYGEYIDTSMGGNRVDPSIFHLSVFNSAAEGSVANLLPIDRADWKHPAGGTYRNPDGTEVWVPIPLNESGAIAETFYNNTAEINIIDGISHVRPHKINRVDDFIELWQVSWAYALVIYHPEYPYYILAREFYDSFENEQAIQQTETYAEAQSLFPSLTNTNFEDDFTGDALVDFYRAKYNENAALKINKEADEPNLLTNYNILQAASMIAHCGNPFFSPTEIHNCQNAHPLFTSGNSEILDLEWGVYRSMAIEIKKYILNFHLEDKISGNGLFSNTIIGSPAGLVYQEKTKRFPTNDEIAHTFPNETGMDFTDDYEMFMAYYNYRAQINCNHCAGVSGIKAIFNGLFSQGKFLDAITFPEAGLSFPVSLVEELSIVTSAPIKWIPRSGGTSHAQVIEVYGDNNATPQMVIAVESDKLPFSEIKFMTCFKALGQVPPGQSNFSAMGYNESLDSTVITGIITGINLECGDAKEAFLCQNATYADDMKYFLTYMFSTGNYDDADFDLFDQFSNNTPQLTPEMDSYLDNENVTDWRWRNVFLNSTELRVNWEFTFLGGSTSTTTFNMTVTDPDFDINDIHQVIAVRKRPSDDEDELLYNFEFTAKTVNGTKFFVSVNTKNTFFPILNCIPFSKIFNKNDDAFCCIKPIKYVPGPTCEDIYAEITEGNRQLREVGILDSLAAKFRTEYAAHCLDAAENLTAAYQEKLYQFTLNYFDQANNLIKTVPPKGVAYLSDTELITTYTNRASGGVVAALNNHQLPSTYRYNSLNNLLRKDNPDEGINEMTYDEIGRIILSRDAVQAVNNEVNYLLYDALGRVAEGGIIDYAIGSLPAKMNYSSASGIVASNAKKEITNFYFDNPLPATDIHFNNRVRNLRNRITSSTYRETEGANYDHASHYGYDIMGNVHTLVQDFDRLSREFPVASGCSTNPLVFEDEIIADGIYQSQQSISTEGIVDISNGSEVVFRAGTEIILKPGFSAGYDFHALIETCVSSEGEPSLAQHIKKVQYDYDFFSGKVNKIWYQPGAEDQFIHYYEYDADNRIISVSTSTFPDEPADMRDVDARYIYYPHGALARVALGQDQVQGIDFAYTINGWLKGINSATLVPTRDMGKDGESNLFGQDAFGMELGYFDNDYQSIQTIAANEQFFTHATTVLNTAGISPLYNGNIRTATYANMGFLNDPVQLHAYQYDQLNRLKNSHVLPTANLGNNTWSGSFANRFATTHAYDANGNIMNLTRRDESGNLLDDLNYSYNANTNQLNYVNDNQSTAYALDLEDQSNNNYRYDEKGRMLTDDTENITAMEWMGNNKLKSLTKNGETIEFQYNSNGQRVLKKDLQKTTYYVRDAMGSILSVYELANDQTTWKYAPIKGVSRMGTYAPNIILGGIQPDTAVVVRGNRQYELTNHLGTMQALVSDRKIPTASGNFTADILNASDYYPFGMLMPDRQVSNRQHPFGFQGMEQDEEVKGEGNAYTTEYRQYDTRVGRWLSVDQVFKAHESPYVGLFNNPNYIVDPNGLDGLKYSADLLLAPEEYGITDPTFGLDNIPFAEINEPRRRRRPRRPRRRQATTENRPQNSFLDSYLDSFSNTNSGDNNNEPIPRTANNTGRTTPEQEPTRNNVMTLENFSNANTAIEMIGMVTGSLEVMSDLSRPVVQAASASGQILGTVGPIASTIGLVSTISENSQAYSDGDIGLGRYVYRSGVNIIGGVGGVVVPGFDNGFNYIAGGTSDNIWSDTAELIFQIRH